MSYSIAGIGMISPWGNDLPSFARSYREGKPAFSPVDRFDAKNIGVTHAALVRDFDPKNYIEPKNVRKYDVFSRFGISASRLAFQSAARQRNEAELEDMGIVMSCETQSMITGSYLDGLVREGADKVSPKLFSVSAANSANCNVAIEMGIQGPSVNVSSKYSAGFLSAYTGAQLIAARQVQESLVGSIDYLSQIVMESHARMGCYKTSVDSDEGFIPGEGTAALLLSSVEHESAYGKLLGLAQECSLQKNYRWPMDAEAQARVLRAALRGYDPESVKKFQSASNGDRGVDQLDREAFERVFGELVSRPEVVCLKHKLGEFSALPLFQVIAACCEPAGTRTLISVLSPGGVHGALLVESSGRLGEI